jgi:hypothetical protein
VLAGSEATLAIRFQALSLVEVDPAVDLDADGLLAPRELDAARASIAGYLARRYRLFERGTELAGELEGLAFAESPDRTPGYQWLEARFRYRAAAPLETLEIDCRLFLEASPFHRDLTRVVHGDDPPAEHVFTAESPRWTFESARVRRPGVLGLFLRLGVEHILTGYDHLAFVLVLLLAVPRWRGLLAVVTAFTVAHSITLGAVAVDPGGWLDRVPDRFVELAIALSIAYVASGNVLAKEPHTPWIEAFGFGLLHGLGFASFLGEVLAGEPLVVSALLGFNLGVELGQLAVVGALGLLLLPSTIRRRRAARAQGAPVPGLAPRWLRRWASAAVTLLALVWFAERAGWIGG